MAKTYKAGDTRKSKKGLLRLSSTGKWFKTSSSPAAQKQRDMNTRLDAPIANLPGTPYQSQTTERQLAHEANAATTTRYGATDSALGQALTQAVQHQSNVNGYYDDYRKSVQDLTTQANAYNAGAIAAMQNLPNLVTGLAGETQGQIGQQQAQRGPEMGAIGAGTTNTNASNAAAISQAAAGSYGAQAALVGNANQQYNANLLNNVIPAQKIQAGNQTQQGITNAQKDITTQKGVEGAYNSNYRDTRRQDETKNLLAGATLGLNTAKAKTSADQTAATARETKRAHLATEAAAQTRIRDARSAAKISAKNASNKRVTTGPFAGMTQKQIDQMSDADAQAKIDAAKKPKKGKGDWLPQGQANKALGDAVKLKSFAQRAKDGKAFVDGHPNQTPLSRSAAAAKLRASTPKTIDEALLSAVLDAVYVGHLSPYTVRKLIAAKYKPSQVASTLGTVTRTGMKGDPKIRDAADSAAKAVKKVL